MKYIRSLAVASYLASTCLQADTFLAQTTPFKDIEDPYREAEAWGMCSAVYELGSLILADTSPSSSEYYSSTGRGAFITGEALRCNM